MTSTGKITRILTATALLLCIWAIQPVKTYAQNETKSQRELKKTKKKRMKDSRVAEKNGHKRHLSIQTKDTRKRMKKHLKQTKKHIETQQHRKF